jgi:hypothetical protein
MGKNTKLLLLATFIMSNFIFLSCGDNNSTILKNTKGTGLVDPVEFGELHNKYLFKALNSSSKIDFSKKSSVKQSFMNVDIPNITSKEQSEIFDYYSSMSIKEKKEKTFKAFRDPKSKDYYNEIGEALDNNINFIDLSKELDLIAIKVNNNLVDSDWDIVMVYLETIRSSADFWYSKDLGAKGLGYRYTSLTNKGQEKLPGWVRADGAGAGLGMAFWGLSALAVTGPVGGVAGFLYGAVSGAVGSSMTSQVKW